MKINGKEKFVRRSLDVEEVRSIAMMYNLSTVGALKWLTDIHDTSKVEFERNIETGKLDVKFYLKKRIKIDGKHSNISLLCSNCKSEQGGRWYMFKINEDLDTDNIYECPNCGFKVILHQYHISFLQSIKIMLTGRIDG